MNANDAIHESSGNVFLDLGLRDVDKRLGYEVGAVDYIIKPFSPSRLIGRIQEILGCRKE